MHEHSKLENLLITLALNTLTLDFLPIYAIILKKKVRVNGWD